MSKTIGDILGDRRDKYSVQADRSVREVVEYMCENNASAVAICEQGSVVGVFSERDLLRRVVHEKLDAARVEVREVMTSPVYWISTDERYEVAKAIMVDKGLRHLVVMCPDRQFLGFISSREILQADLSDSRELVGKLNDDYYEHRFMPAEWKKR